MLNHAHQLQRQAEKATKKGRVTEAIQKHREAAEILRGLLETIVNEKANQSVRVQAEFHEREQRLLQDYSQRCDRLAENLAHLRVTMEGHHQPPTSDAKNYGFAQLRRGEPHDAAPSRAEKAPPTITTSTPSSSQHQDRNLQTNIYRAFDDAETLIGRLRGEGADEDGTAAAAASSQRAAAASSAASGTKKPKDDKVIIEELEVANCHLRNMVDSLFVELDHCRGENIDLKEKIHELEERIRLGDLRQRATRNLHPSPSSGRSRPSDMELPLLPPLDVPTFNFDQ